MVLVRCSVGEQMISACVFPNVKHGGVGVMVWGCFTGDTVSDLFRIQADHCILQEEGGSGSISRITAFLYGDALLSAAASTTGAHTCSRSPCHHGSVVHFPDPFSRNTCSRGQMF